MKAIVTGAAGFIGSTLAAQLLDEGWEVVGIDRLTDYYSPVVKRENVRRLQMHHPHRFRWVHDDLVTTDLDTLFEGASVVYHLAGQPGVRSSWRDRFEQYTRDNVVATQRVLDSALRLGGIRVVYASSSSVYGNAAVYPCHENQRPQPHSPYGVTKMAGEHLAVLYADNFGLQTVSLRYFTVYGPRQRPEMAMAQIIDATLRGHEFGMFAAPGSIRDFTYVEDIARGTLLAGVVDDVPAGMVLNLCGGEPTTLDDVIERVEDLVGAPLQVERVPTVAGDVLRTGGDSTLAQRWLGWKPETPLHEGLAQQVEHHRWMLEQSGTPVRRSSGSRHIA